LIINKHVFHFFLPLSLGVLLFNIQNHGLITNVINVDSINFYYKIILKKDVIQDYFSSWDNNFLYKVIFTYTNFYIYCFHILNIFIVFHLCKNNMHLFLIFPFLFTNIFLSSKEFLGIYVVLFFCYALKKENYFFWF